MPIIYVAQNFEYGLLKQTTRNPIVQKIVYYGEKFACLKANRILCVSEKDKHDFQTAYHIAEEKLIVVPNTVDIEYFSQTQVLYNKIIERQQLGINQNSFVLIFSGRMDYRPNVEALKFILNELTPALATVSQDIMLLIVGAQIPEWCRKIEKRIVLFYANVPDMRRFYSVADAAIVPLNSGGGTRIKILESFAAKIPVISSAIGCEGIECEDGKHLILTNRTAEDLIKKATDLIENAKKREYLISNAFNLVLHKYSTETATRFLQKLLTELNNNI